MMVRLVYICCGVAIIAICGLAYSQTEHGQRQINAAWTSVNGADAAVSKTEKERVATQPPTGPGAGDETLSSLAAAVMLMTAHDDTNLVMAVRELAAVTQSLEAEAAVGIDRVGE